MVLSKQVDGSYKASVVSYNLTDSEKQAIKAGNTPIDIAQKTFVSSMMSRESVGEPCYEAQTITIISPRDISASHTINIQAEVPCPTDDSDDGFWDDDGDTSGGGGANPGTGSDPFGGLLGGGNGIGDGTGNPNQTDPDDPDTTDPDGTQDCLELDAEGNCMDDATAILVPNETKDCEELRKNSENTTFKQRMQVLADAIPGDIEKAFGIYNGTYFNPPVSNPACGPIVDGDENHSGIVNSHPVLKAYAHNHLKNASGTRKHIGTFSPKDITNFNNIFTDSNSDDSPSPLLQHEMAYYLVCDEGNYVMKVKDGTKLLDFTILMGSDGFAKEVKDYYRKNKIKHGKPKKDQNLGFLKFMKEYNIGIDLYEADANFENWKKLELNEDENDINKTDC
ncbi:hypothetical protein [Winogradskyella eximia]|uniref:hypothetical protein n=1 Tax=Winogradskyella eximia TaxID=262006 RepID=UPI001C6E3644|nr:hypothetical protein [Winogradskyella eximia]